MSGVVYTGADMVHVLQSTLSNDPTVRNPASDEIQRMSKLTGYCASLLDVFANTSVDKDVRHMAGVNLKNTINARWASSTKKIEDEEKNYIRGNILNHMNQPSSKLATALALVIARISRFDLPLYWPNLLDSLVAIIQGSDPVCTRVGLLTFHHVVEELISRKYRPGTVLFESFAPQLGAFVMEMWTNKMTNFVGAIRDASTVSTLSNESLAPLVEEGELGVLCVKVCREIIVCGYPAFNNSPEVPAFFNLLHQCLSELVVAAKPLIGHNKLGPVLQDLLIASISCVVNVQNTHPLSFVPLLESWLGFVRESLFSFAAGTVVLPEAFVVKCMHFIKNVLEEKKYIRPQLSHAGISQATAEATSNAKQVVEAFFAPELLGGLAELLLLTYIPLRQEDLNEWMSEPEQFVLTQTYDRWEYDVRPCALTLFTSLVSKHQQVLVPYLVHMLGQAENMPLNSVVDVLKKDAVYTVAGACQWELAGHISLNDWFNQSLCKELQRTEPELAILRARIMYITQEWSANFSDEQVRDNAYGAIIHVLGESDKVVRFAAVSALRRLVDDTEFKTERFLPFSKQMIELLFNLMLQCNDSFAQLRCMDTVTMILDRLRHHLRPLAPDLASTIGMLWNTNCEEMLKSSLLLLASKIVTSLGVYSDQIHSLIIPLLNEALSTGGLLEDGIELWNNTLKRAPVLTPDLANLFLSLRTALEKSGEVKMCVSILKNYLLFNDAGFVAANAAEMAGIVMNAITTAKDSFVPSFLGPMQMMIQVMPDAPSVFAPVLPGMVEDVINQKRPALVMMGFVSVFARILLSNPNFFVSFFSSANGGVDALSAFIGVWMNKWDQLSDPLSRKLHGIAISSLMVTTENSVLQHFPSAVINCTGILFEAEGTPERPGYEILCEKEALQPSEHEPKLNREYEFFHNDLVNKRRFREHLQDSLAQCLQVNGSERFGALMAAVPQVIQGQLSQFITL